MLHRHAGPAVAGGYTSGAILGATTTAAGLLLASGLLSPLPHDLRGAIAICGSALLLLHATKVLCLDFLPQRAYQIPRETFSTRPAHAAFRFAFELGTGVRTYITAAAPYGLALLLLLVPPPGLGAAALSAGTAALGYGLGRSLIVGIQSLRSAVSVEHPARWLRLADVTTVVLTLATAIRLFTHFR